MNILPKFRAEERDDGSIVSDYQIATVLINISARERFRRSAVRVRDTMLMDCTIRSYP